jgi:anti-anti-sigma regulatory factor
MAKAKGAKSMTLRIQRSDDNPWVVFTLCGRIQADHLPELEELLKSASAEHKLVLDLQQVKLVDRDVVRFLAEIEQTRANLRNCPAFIRQWISRERSGLLAAENEGSAGLAR